MKRDELVLVLGVPGLIGGGPDQLPDGLASAQATFSRGIIPRISISVGGGTGG